LRRRITPLVPPIVAAVGGFALAVAAYYPGSLSNDSITMFQQVTGGYWTNAKPPTMRHLWWVTNQAICGPGGILLVHLLAYWGGVLLIATECAKGAAARSAIVVGLGLLPPSFGLLAVIWVDVGMTSFLLLGTGIALHARRRRPRLLLSLLALAALAFGALLRFNAIAALPPLLLLVVRGGFRSESPRRNVRALVAAAVLTVVVFGLSIVIQQWGTSRRMASWAAALVWDLAAITVETQEMWVPDYVLVDPGRQDGVEMVEELFRRSSSVSLYWGPHVFADFGIDPERLRPLPGDWLAAVRLHPGAYLRHRLRTAAGLLGLWRSVGWGSYFFDTETRGVTDHCAAPASFERNRLNLAIEGALEVLSRTPVYRLWVYCLLSLGVLAFWLRRRIEGASTAALVAASGLLYLAPQPLIVPSVEFRYGLWTLVSAVVAAVLLGAAVVEDRRKNGAARV
jgi:hypothetical protein